jgi:colanic acid/amylovoran biosynthesis glycosyltransferase
VQQRFGLRPDSRFILCPSRLDRHKGIETLIDAAELLQDDHYIKRMNLKFLVAGGSGEVRYREFLEKLVKDKDLHDIVLLGPSDHTDCDAKEMKWLYRNADACVLPSKREGFSQALLEAFVHKTPVLASNTEGNPEIVRPEQTGYLFDRDGPQKLARQLELFTNPHQTRKMVENASATVERDYSATGMARKLFTLYCEAAGITIKETEEKGPQKAVPCSWLPIS